MTPKIYILLPVHNRRETTQTFIQCLMKQTFVDYELILIDDGSTDGTAEMVKGYLPAVTVLRGTGEWWWAGSLQQGLDLLTQRRVDDSALILFINDDVTFGPRYLEQAVDVMRERKGSLVLSKAGGANGGDIIETGVVADLRRLSFVVSGSADRINCLPTRGLFAYLGDIRKIGGFHPKLLPHYLSDYEYTIRAHRKGFKCQTSSDLIIVPNEATTGFHDIAEKHFGTFLKKLFSKKATSNPLYWSSFVILTSSPAWMIPNLARIWFIAGRRVVRGLLDSLQNDGISSVSPKAR